MHGKVLTLVVFLGIMLAIAGCASTPAPAPAATQAPASGTAPSSGAPAVTSSGGGLVPSPTDAIPSSRTLNLNIEKDYLGNVVVTFQGGAGNGHVKKFDVTVNRADGQVETGSVGINIGDTVTIPGDKDTDRVIVTASMDDGKTYKVVDKTIAFKGLG